MRSRRVNEIRAAFHIYTSNRNDLIVRKVYNWMTSDQGEKERKKMENYTLATGYQQREELKEGFNCLANRSI